MPVMGKVKFNKKTGRAYASGRLVKTDKYKEFESRAAEWSLRYRSGLEKLKSEIIKRRQELAAKGQILTLRVDAFAIFPREKLYCQKGNLERIDADNRLKPCQDVLFSILCIDDRHVFRSEIEKVPGTNGEYMVIRISEYTPKTELEVKAMLGLK